MTNLEKTLGEVEFAKVIFPRANKSNAHVLEFDAVNPVGQKLSSIFLTLAYNDDGVLNQIFMNQGKSGGDENAHAQSLGILTSIGLQHGIPPQSFIKTLKGIQSNVRPFELSDKNKKIVYSSIEDLIAAKMTEYIIGVGEPTEVPDDGKYSHQILKTPDEGKATYIKLNMGKSDSPPLYVFFSEDKGGLLSAIFLTRGKSGGNESAHAESLGKLISIPLQYGLHPYRIVKALVGIKSSLMSYGNGSIFQSMEDALGRSILKWYSSRGVNLEEFYNKFVKSETTEDPTKSLSLEELTAVFLPNEKSPCPACGSIEYDKIQKPGTRGCFEYSCCRHPEGSCE